MRQNSNPESQDIIPTQSVAIVYQPLVDGAIVPLTNVAPPDADHSLLVALPKTAPTTLDIQAHSVEDLSLPVGQQRLFPTPRIIDFPYDISDSEITNSASLFNQVELIDFPCIEPPPRDHSAALSLTLLGIGGLAVAALTGLILSDYPAQQASSVATSPQVNTTPSQTGTLPLQLPRPIAPEAIRISRLPSRGELMLGKPSSPLTQPAKAALPGLATAQAFSVVPIDSLNYPGQLPIVAPPVTQAPDPQLAHREPVTQVPSPAPLDATLDPPTDIDSSTSQPATVIPEVQPPAPNPIRSSIEAPTINPIASPAAISSPAPLSAPQSASPASSSNPVRPPLPPTLIETPPTATIPR